MNQKIGIKQVVAIGIGTALFAVLTMVQVPGSLTVESF